MYVSFPLKKMFILKNLLYFFVLLLTYSLFSLEAIKVIPEDVRAHLRNSTTLAELSRKMHTGGLDFPVFSNHDRGTTTSMPLATAGHGKGSKIKGRQNSFVQNQYAPGTGVEIIDEPVQSQDSCKIVRICAGLNLKKDPNIFYFPECIDMDQCLGGCCDNSHNCHPVDFEVVKVKVSAWKYEGMVNGQQKFVPHEQLLVDMQRHKKCGCEQCKEKPVCGHDHQLIGCRCLCKNNHESLHCTGRHYWSDETCRCECSRTWCPDGQVFSERECKCVGGRG